MLAVRLRWVEWVRRSSTRLNVVVFDGSLPTGAPGWTCPSFDEYPGRVIFLEWSDQESLDRRSWLTNWGTPWPLTNLS